MKISEKMKLNANYFILLLSTIFLFLVLNLINNINTMYIDLFGKRIKANDSVMLKENDEYYLSYEYVKENLDSEIYFDTISRKVVISSEVGLLKARVNEKNININYEEVAINSVGVIEKENIYISLEVLEKAYGLEITVSSNTVYIYKNVSFDGKVKYNNVHVYLSSNLKSKSVDYVDKKDKIKAIYEKDNFVFVKVNEKNVGYISKKLLKYSIEKQEIKQDNLEQKNYIFADSSNTKIQSGMPINGVLVDMFEVTQVSATVNEKNINNNLLTSIIKNGYKIYGIVNNGYDLSGFNTATLSQILSDETKRLNLINNLSSKIEKYNLAGIVLDFKRLKEKDISNYIQFVKEFKAFSGKEVIVNIDANEYKKLVKLINYSDFSIINTYGQRDLKSTVSGSVSEISWMKEIIENSLKEAHNEKVVVAIPSYSILWTEKNSHVIDAEIYNLKAIKDYINKNNLDVKEVSGQNYVEMKKGSLVYRMWLEDELSISNRLKIIKENNLAGVAIYKLGYENNTLIDVLKNN